MKEKCGARRKYDGQPCQAKALPSGRCRFHGGMSTGPKTLPGKIRSMSSLRPFAGCRKEMLGVADALERGRREREAFDKLIASNSPYAESAARKIAAWAMT